MNNLKFSAAHYALWTFLLTPFVAIGVLLLGALAPALAVLVAILIIAAWLPLVWAVYMATKQRRVLGTMEVTPDANR